MYFKLQNADTNFGGSGNTDYASYRQYVLETLRDIIMGDITTTSQLPNYMWNQSGSTITGSAPSAGIYHETGAYRNCNASQSGDDYFLGFFKRHHGYLQDNTNANMQRYVHIRMDGTYHMTPRMCTHGTNSATGWTNPFPSGTSGWYDAGVADISTAGASSPQYMESIEGIINDKVFVLKMNLSPYSSSYGDLIFIMCDQEYQPNYDHAQRAEQIYHCPTVAILHGEFKLEQNNTIGKTSTSGTKAGNCMGKTKMYGIKYPNGDTHSDSYTSYYTMGNQSTSVSNDSYASLFPPPWFEMHASPPIADGNRGFTMQPLLFMPHYGLSVLGSDHVDYKEHSRLIGMWRTADDSFYSGERVVDGSGNAYRAFRAYKLSSPTTSNDGYDEQWGYNKEHSKSAVYLFPEGGQ